VIRWLGKIELAAGGALGAVAYLGAAAVVRAGFYATVLIERGASRLNSGNPSAGDSGCFSHSEAPTPSTFSFGACHDEDPIIH